MAADDFPIAGFAPATKARGKPVQLAFKTPEEVVGNAIAKHQMMRLSRMLVAYDFDRRMNPFVELGGFIYTFLGDGKPGTGKTTLIQMMAGLINDYCQSRAIRSAMQNCRSTMWTPIRASRARTRAPLSTA